MQRVAARERGPVRVGELLPEILARYGVSATNTPAKRRPHPMAAAWLGQETLAELAEA